MEVPGGQQKKSLVAAYELIGTALFVYMIIVSKGEPLAVPLALFAVIIIFGGVTGGHFNPAVTAGVYIHEGKYKENALYCTLIMISQIIGGLLGSLVAGVALSANVNNEWSIPESRVPILAPTDPNGENDFDMASDSNGFSQEW